LIFGEFTHVAGHLTFACWREWRVLQSCRTNGAGSYVKFAAAPVAYLPHLNN